jgi:plasmid stability protein
MAQMIVRNIDEGVAERFKAKAKAQGKSAEQFLRDIMAEEVKPTREELFRTLDEIRGGTAGKAVIDPVSSIRQDRDRGHGGR